MDYRDRVADPGGAEPPLQVNEMRNIYFASSHLL